MVDQQSPAMKIKSTPNRYDEFSRGRVAEAGRLAIEIRFPKEGAIVGSFTLTMRRQGLHAVSNAMAVACSK